MFAPDELIAALSDGGVEYVLIGGLAVGAHGFPRATKDLDIVPAPDDGNLDRARRNHYVARRPPGAGLLARRPHRDEACCRALAGSSRSRGAR
jgi:hypothetical protein